MRLAPVPLFYARNRDAAVYLSGESSRTTHGAATCVDACRHLGALIVDAVAGAEKQKLLSVRDLPLETREVVAIASGSFRGKEPPEIRGSGYVVESLEAALWALDRSDSFEEGVLLAVNLGDDADTTGAVYGQLAGAIYGEEAIPRGWRDQLALQERIESFANRLCELGPR